MSQVTGVGFSNFRVFEKHTFFHLAPISLFTGTNSSGKSSVFKGLKLLQNNAKDIGKLNFSGEGHNLGTFNLARSRHSNSDLIRFVLEIDHSFLLVMDYKPADQENGNWCNLMLTIHAEYKETYEDNELILRIYPPEADEPYLRTFTNISYLIEKYLDEQVNRSKPNDTAGRKLAYRTLYYHITSAQELTEHIPDLDIVEAINLAEVLKEAVLNTLSRGSVNPVNVFGRKIPEPKTMFEILNEMRLGRRYILEKLDSQYCKEQISKGFIDIENVLKANNKTVHELINSSFISNVEFLFRYELEDLFKSIQKAINEISYLEAIRANAQRLYANQWQGTNFNTQLSNLGEIEGREFVEKWLKNFCIGDKLNISRIKGIATEVKIEKEGEETDLIDLGYGATQLLPIMLMIVSRFNYKPHMVQVRLGQIEPGTERETPKEPGILRQNGPLLLIEEPEANLHPKLQSLLADFFVDVAKNFEVTLLLETHSEYLIRRMQVLTAAREVNPEDTIIYYLNNNTEKSNQNFVTTIKINFDGSLTNDFGPGFVDEATKWMLELARLKNAQIQNLN